MSELSVRHLGEPWSLVQERLEEVRATMGDLGDEIARVEDRGRVLRGRLDLNRARERELTEAIRRLGGPA